MRIGLVAALPLLLFLPSAEGWGQATELDQADPSQIERRVEPRRTPEPKPAPELDLPARPGAVQPEGEAESFVLTAVSVEGASAFGPEVITPLYEDFLAERITLKDVAEIVRRITALYQDAGFLLSRAVAPPQDLAAGMLRVRIVEGFIDKVTLTGESPLRRFVAHTEPIKDERPLSNGTLQRYVLLINDLPGVSADPSIRPLDEDSGRYELILSVEQDSVDGTLYVDNRGTPAVGRLESWASAGVNGLFGSDERFELGYFTVPNEPDELQFVQLAYSQPLGTEGTVLSANTSVSLVDPSDDLDALDVASVSRSYSVSLSHPILRSRDQSFWVSGTFDAYDATQELRGVTLFDDRLRVFRARGVYTVNDGLDGTNSVQLEVSRGVGAFGASEAGSPQLSRTDGHGRFTKVGATVVRRQALGENFGLQLSAAGQWASEPLLSSEEYALGGSQFGRAFDFAELTGEHGLAGSVELIYGRSLDNDWLPSFQIYGFYDLGAVWNDVAGGGTTRDALSSTGGGVRLRLGDLAFANLEIAKPINREVVSKDSDAPRVFFSFSANF